MKYDRRFGYWKIFRVEHAIVRRLFQELP